MNEYWKLSRFPRGGKGTYSSRSLHGQVVHEIGRRIVSGVIGEGDVLPNETELGAAFEVSRTALREGIKVLTAKGLLSSRTRTGTRVRPRNEWNMLDPDVLFWRMEVDDPHKFSQDLIEFRRAVEPMAASLAALRANDEELQSLRDAYDDLVKAGDDIEAAEDPDMRFHNVILMASGNEFLAPLGVMVEMAMRNSFHMATPELRLNALSLHKDVLDAIEARDPDRASVAMGAVLDFAIDSTKTVLNAS